MLLRDPEEVILALLEIHGKDPNTLFFDEIQNMEKWEIFVNRLHREGYDIYLTDSNAKLLSSEPATHLTGRHIGIGLFPFSFKKYLRSKGIDKPDTRREKAVIKGELHDYLHFGGFPEFVVEEENPKIYLRELFSNILEKDVVFRKRIRYVRTFKEIAFSLLSNISTEVFSKQSEANFQDRE